MQYKVIRHRNKDGSYRKGYRVQCLRRVREVTPDFPEGRNVQRVVATFDREARDLLKHAELHSVRVVPVDASRLEGLAGGGRRNASAAPAKDLPIGAGRQ